MATRRAGNLTLPLAAIIVGAHAADLATFWYGVSVLGIDAELNPLVRHMVESWGYLGNAIVKIGAALFLVVVAATAARLIRRRWYVILAVVVASAPGVAGAIGNLLATH